MGVVPLSEACDVGIPAQWKGLNADVVFDAAPPAQRLYVRNPEIALACVADMSVLEVADKVHSRSLIDNYEPGSA
nr:hypothetical protein [Mycobacterium eburneum]